MFVLYGVEHPPARKLLSNAKGGAVPKVSDAHREARREEIVAAAMRAFTTKGFGRTSMADVIAEAGLSAGAIYGHFAGKEDLFAAVVQTVLGRRREELSDAIARGPAPSPGEAVAILVRGMARERFDTRALVQVWAEATIEPRIAAIVSEALGIIRGALERALRAWFAEHPEQAADDTESAIARLVPVMMGLGQGFIVQRSMVDGFDERAYLATIAALLPH
jgi:AcrR family transcriptional regulator